MRLNWFGYYGDFFISLALIVLLATIALTDTTLAHRTGWAGCALLGFAVWTLLEYGVHRVLYHQVPYFRELHHAHHAEPDAHIGAPPFIGIVGIFGVFYLPLMLCNHVLANGVTTGVLAGYVAYMVVHHADHYWAVDEHAWLYPLRRHHALHHHHTALGNFGIITSFWDHVFGTALQRPQRVARHQNNA